MSKFSDFWKTTMHKAGRDERIKSIDARMLQLAGEMQKRVDPTAWNVLLNEQEELEKERAELVAMPGPFKDQTDVI